MPLLQAAVRFYPDAFSAGTVGSLRRAVGGSPCRTTLVYAVALFVAGVAVLGTDVSVILLGCLLTVETARAFRDLNDLAVWPGFVGLFNRVGRRSRQRAWTGWWRLGALWPPRSDRLRCRAGRGRRSGQKA